MGRTTQLLNPFQNGNEPGKNAQVVRLRGKPTRQKVANQSRGRLHRSSEKSPLLANLFLHVTFDKWFEKHFPKLSYERYADDVIVHCHSQKQAEYVLDMIRKRMTECKLELHPEKTKIIYCKRNYKEKSPYKPEHASFDFLGFTFRPHRVKTMRGKFITGFRPGISKKSRTKIWKTLRELKLHRIVGATIDQLGRVEHLNLKIRGWINYYGKYRLSDLRNVFRVLNHRI